jgi:hypothetical protein
MTKVNVSGSTCCASADYDKKTQTLTITFVKGGSHTYHGVEPQIVRAFGKAGSHGRYFNFRIRNEY